MSGPMKIRLDRTMCDGFGACAKHDDHAHGEGHVHKAPHGGTLLEVGEHAYNLELVRDTEAGKLTVYVLDGHAENFVRIAAPELQLTAYSGERRTLPLKAIANSATGDDCSAKRSSAAHRGRSSSTNSGCFRSATASVAAFARRSIKPVRE